MTDWTKPDFLTLKANFPGEVRSLAQSAASMDYGSDTNLQDGMLKYNRSTNRFQERVAGSWVDRLLDYLKDGAVSATAKIADGIITAAKIVDGTITSAKLAPDAATRHTLLGQWWSPSFTGSASVFMQPPGAYDDTDKDLVMVGSGVITHIGFTMNASLDAGSVYVKLYKNAAYTGQSIAWVGGNAGYGALLTPISFSAGDLISIQSVTASLVQHSGKSSASAQVWGHFTS